MEVEKTPDWLVALLCILGILVCAGTYGPALKFSARGLNDFRTFYPAARLVGSTAMYDPQQVLAIQLETTGRPGRPLPYCRPPYVALVLAPLGRLPYLSACAVWEALCLAAAVAFALLCGGAGRKLVVLACCWSLPLFAGLAVGQDTALLLLIIALALRLNARGRPFASGIVFALCAAKFHLFLLLPLLILGRRMWRFAGGLLAGGGVLLLLSFLAAGPDWPRAYAAVLTSPQANPNYTSMPNLYAFVAATGSGPALELSLAALVAALVWVAVRNAGFACALTATLVGSLLVSHHAYLADSALMLPGLLMLAAHSTRPWLRFGTVFLMTPLCYWGMFTTSGGWVTRGAIAAFLVAVTWAAWRGEGAPDSTPAAAAA